MGGGGGGGGGGKGEDMHKFCTRIEFLTKPNVIHTTT